MNKFNFSVSSGSFVYDVQLPLNEWNPTADELRLLSAEMIGFSRQGKVIKKLVVGEELALDIFEGSSYKQQQIPHIASTNDGKFIFIFQKLITFMLLIKKVVSQAMSVSTESVTT